MADASPNAIAKLLDMTPRRVQQLVKEGILPKPIARGQYEIIPCVVAYIKHLKASLMAGLDTPSARKDTSIICFILTGKKLTHL